MKKIIFFMAVFVVGNGALIAARRPVIGRAHVTAALSVAQQNPKPAETPSATVLSADLSPSSSTINANITPANFQSAVKETVDRIMKPYMIQANIPGAIVGVTLNGNREFFAYGKATDAGTLFTPDTLVEIGSCTKTFTTTLFALAIGRNQINPNASVQNYMPKGYMLRPQAQAMTPLELADFTSGLPDDPPSLPKELEMRGIEHYTTHDFLTWISNWVPSTPLPAPFLYSNSGVGLLGYLLATTTDKTWENQVNQEIIEQLGMPDTRLRLTPEQQKRHAQGHLSNGRDAPIWPIYAWYAAGGLRSTARDMLTFAEANLGHAQVNGRTVPAELTKAMKLAQKPIYNLPKKSNIQAMAWINEVGDNRNLNPVIIKDGETAGFSTGIALNPAKNLAVFVAINQAGADPVGKGTEITRAINVPA